MGKRRNKNKTGRRRPINDVPMNDTNIRVRFKKVITFDYVTFQEKVLLNPSISTLTTDLAVVYKLYRCTSLKLTFQAATYLPGSASQPRHAINYVPALEFTASSPLSVEDYEGPAVGFWQANRGHPYTWKIPGNVLNAMPYNWYETKSNSPDVSDLTQGTILSTSDLETTAETALMEIVMEFQTLEDPEFLAQLVRENEHNSDFEVIQQKRVRPTTRLAPKGRISTHRSQQHSLKRRTFSSEPDHSNSIESQRLDPDRRSQADYVVGKDDTGRPVYVPCQL